MPLQNILQPEILIINETIRLRKYDGNYQILLKGYQDPYVYQNSEGIFDEQKKPDLNYLKGMCTYLNQVGELYFIEIKENQTYVSIGDVTIKDKNPPIAIWYEKYRGKGIGTLVMQTVIKRLKELGYQKIIGSTVYKWNHSSQKMHENLGFKRVKETTNEYIYELDLIKS